MLSLTSLLLPSLLSALAVFVVSSIIHMLSPWHKGDYRKMDRQTDVMDALRGFSIPPGDYLVPRPDSRGEMQSPEFQELAKRGPMFVMTIWDAGSVSMGKSLGGWFLYLFLVGMVVGHIAARAVPEGADHRAVFHTIALSSFLGYAGALWQMTIWYRRSWLTTLKSSIDGLIYAVVTALIFGYFWK